MRIPVTRNFDTTDPIGYLTLHEDIEIAPDMLFALRYDIIEQASDGRPVKIRVLSVSLILDRFYKPMQSDAQVKNG